MSVIRFVYNEIIHYFYSIISQLKDLADNIIVIFHILRCARDDEADELHKVEVSFVFSVGVFVVPDHGICYGAVTSLQVVRGVRGSLSDNVAFGHGTYRLRAVEEVDLQGFEVD